MIASASNPIAAPRASPHRRASKVSSKPSYSSSTTSVAADSYYGHEESSKLAASYITYLFSCPDVPPASTSVPAGPSPTLAHFIAYSLHRTRLAASVTYSALFLLNRLKGRFPAARGSSGHRLFISAFMIASKVVCDDTYSNKSWCVVGQGMFSLREINQMEREMCGYLEWVLNVPPQELEEFEVMLRKDFGNGATPIHSKPAAVSVPVAAPLHRPSTREVPYPSPESTPPSPSHSNSTSPASSTCQTPPSTDTASTAPVHLPKSMKTGGEHPRLQRDPSFAFAAPAVW